MKKLGLATALLTGLAIAVSGQASAQSVGLGGDSSAKAATRAPVTTSCGTLGNFKTRTDTPAGNVTTTSTTYVDVPGTYLAFTAGGATNSCALVTMSARMLAVDPDTMFMRVLMDGVTVAEPGEVVMASKDPSGYFTARSYTWVFPSVTPGAHSFRIQFKTTASGTAYLYQHAVVLQYR